MFIAPDSLPTAICMLLVVLCAVLMTLLISRPKDHQ